MLGRITIIACLACTLAKVKSASVSDLEHHPFTGMSSPIATAALQRRQSTSTDSPHPSTLLQSSGSTVTGGKKQQLAAAQPCPTGFVKHRGSCYHWVTATSDSRSQQQRASFVVRHNRSSAAEYCSSLGSQLVSIESEAEQFFVERTLSKTDGKAYWTSGRTSLTDGKWKWESSGQELGYFNWLADYSSWPYEGSPNNSTCLIIDASADYQWMFWPCDSDYYVVGSRRSVRVSIGLICELSRRQGGKSRRRKVKAKHKSDRA